MGYEIDFLPVGDGSRSGDAIALRYGNLLGDRSEQTVIVIDGGFTDDGEALVALITNHYGTDYVDIVVATHPEQDHIKGLEIVLEQLRVGQLWMHKPWAHSSTLSASRSSSFGNIRLSEKLQESMREASDLEVLASRLRIPVIEPFTGLASADRNFFVIGPDPDYYDELLEQMPGVTQEAATASLLRKLAEVAQRLVPETLLIETLTDTGETSAQNNSSVISVLEFDGRISIFTGDAGMPALDRATGVLENAGYTPGRCKFIQIPHHGSRRNVGPTILDRLLGSKGTEDNRGTAYVSAAKAGGPKHPAKKVTNAFRRRGYLPHATQGDAKRHHHDAPPRPGYSACDPLPLFTEVEHTDD
jgi:beta-lactamase superfamily II metal-dependent hydrolase